MNIFEQACRTKLRFPSPKGDLMVEQLWDMPLQSKSGFDLDTLAKATSRALRDQEDDSFVAPKKANPELSLRMELIKHIIAAKMAENAAKAEQAQKAVKRQQLLAALEAKENEAIHALSADQLRQQLADLDS